MKIALRKLYQKIGHKLRELLFFISCFNRKENSEITFNLSSQDKIYILTTKHCLFIADLIRNNLNKAGINSEIIFRRPEGGYGNGLHFVVCPQMFFILPKNYVAYQLEQSISSRWFTPDYLRRLKYAYCIFDYSLDNVNYLKNNGINSEKIYFMPISYNSGYAEVIGKQKEEYDVIFYGDSSNERRQKYLQALSKKFNLKIISNLFGKELYQELSKAKIIANIHYYDGALLETTRLYESLSLNKFIISETSSDIKNHSELQRCVDFVEINNIEAMCDQISFWLENDNQRINKIQENVLYLNTHFENQFDKNFSFFLKKNY